MAQIALSVVAEGILSKTLSLVAEDVTLLWDLKGNLIKLAHKLEKVQALLSDAEHRSSSKFVQLWLNEFKAVAYEADDALDEFQYEVLRQKVEVKDQLKKKVRDFVSTSKNPVAFHVSMAQRIENINLLLDETFKSAIDMGLRPGEVINMTRKLIESHRLTHPYLGTSIILGRENDVTKLVEVLCSSGGEKALSVISIVGMGGQGKTAIAKLVYQKAKVHFEYVAWICVSDNFEVARLLNEMVESLIGEESQLQNVKGIIGKLVKALGGKKFFLVLDDVWNKDSDKWNCMRDALAEVGGYNGSKILVTTRSHEVASAMQSSVTHYLGKLSKDDSWSLFKQIAFMDGVGESSSLVAIGKRIVNKCCGLPLAIKVLGSLMSSKKDESEWLSIENNHIWDSPEGGGILPVLKLSYDHLPSPSLKHCFSYTAIFNKDTDIRKDNLVRMWMALGLLHPPERSNLMMEDVGALYFDTLLRNCLLQDVVIDEFGKITGCKMHDLVHDLAVSVSNNYCLALEGNKVRDTPVVVQRNASYVVHLYVTSELQKVPEIQNQVSPRLRTLFLRNGLLGDMLENFKCLRTLVLSNRSIKELPSSIGGLKHLRYLDISDTFVTKLPSSICKLYNLQTLIVFDYLNECPEKFCNLISLRHFYGLNAKISGMGHLSALQTIPIFSVSQKQGCQTGELGGLKNLTGTLRIEGLHNVMGLEDARKINLVRKSKIEHLHLSWLLISHNNDADCGNDESVLKGLQPHPNLKSLEIFGFNGKDLPSWMGVESAKVLYNLVRIKLSMCENCERTPALGNLPRLQKIDITYMSRLKRIGIEFYGGQQGQHDTVEAMTIGTFPALRSLTLSQLKLLEEWAEPHPSMKFPVFPEGLTELVIQYLTNLRCLPEGLFKGGSLTSLRIFGCPKLIGLPRGLFEACSMSLRYLSIRNCESMSTPDLSCLKKLRVLNVHYISEGAKDIHRLLPAASLEELKLSGWSKLKFLPEQMFPQQQLSFSLKKLTIDGFDELESLPEQLGHLSSLQNLEFSHCNRLKNLPSMVALQRLTSLRQISIIKCQHLGDRCSEQNGPERHKIAHIPNIKITEDYMPRLEPTSLNIGGVLVSTDRGGNNLNGTQLLHKVRAIQRQR